MRACVRACVRARTARSTVPEMPKIRKKRCWSACPGSRYALRIAKQKYKQKATYHILRSYPTRQGHRTQNNDPTRNTIVLQAPCAEPGVACLADEPRRYQLGSSSGAVACTAAMCRRRCQRLCAHVRLAAPAARRSTANQ